MMISTLIQTITGFNLHHHQVEDKTRSYVPVHNTLISVMPSATHNVRICLFQNTPSVEVSLCSVNVYFP